MNARLEVIGFKAMATSMRKPTDEELRMLSFLADWLERIGPYKYDPESTEFTNDRAHQLARDNDGLVGPHAMSELRRVYLLTRKIESATGKRAKVLSRVGGAVAVWNRHYRDKPNASPDTWLATVRDLSRDLSEIDVHFAVVTLDSMRELLQKACDEHRGGRGKLGSLGVAAKLSLCCGAFGDSDEQAALAAFRALAKKR